MMGPARMKRVKVALTSRHAIMMEMQFTMMVRVNTSVVLTMGVPIKKPVTTIRKLLLMTALVNSSHAEVAPILPQIIMILKPLRTMAHANTSVAQTLWRATMILLPTFPTACAISLHAQVA
jgi:hypothetical protein